MKNIANEKESSLNCPIEQSSFGVWHVRGYKEAQAVLRSGNVRRLVFRLKC